MIATAQRGLFLFFSFLVLPSSPAGRFSRERASQLHVFCASTCGVPLPFLSAGELLCPTAVASTCGFSTRLAGERTRERPAVYTSSLACSCCPFAVPNFHYLDFWDRESPKNCSRTKRIIRPPNTMGGNSERLLCFT